MYPTNPYSLVRKRNPLWDSSTFTHGGGRKLYEYRDLPICDRLVRVIVVKWLDETASTAEVHNNVSFNQSFTSDKAIDPGRWISPFIDGRQCLAKVEEDLGYVDSDDQVTELHIYNPVAGQFAIIEHGRSQYIAKIVEEVPYNGSSQVMNATSGAIYGWDLPLRPRDSVSYTIGCSSYLLRIIYRLTSSTTPGDASMDDIWRDIRLSGRRSGAQSSNGIALFSTQACKTGQYVRPPQGPARQDSLQAEIYYPSAGSASSRRSGRSSASTLVAHRESPPKTAVVQNNSHAALSRHATPLYWNYPDNMRSSRSSNTDPSVAAVAGHKPVVRSKRVTRRVL